MPKVLRPFLPVDLFACEMANAKYLNYLGKNIFGIIPCIHKIRCLDTFCQDIDALLFSDAMFCADAA